MCVPIVRHNSRAVSRFRTLRLLRSRLSLTMHIPDTIQRFLTQRPQPRLVYGEKSAKVYHGSVEPACGRHVKRRPCRTWACAATKSAHRCVTERSTHLLGDAREQPASIAAVRTCAPSWPVDRAGGLVYAQAVRRHLWLRAPDTWSPVANTRLTRRAVA